MSESVNAGLIADLTDVVRDILRAVAIKTELDSWHSSLDRMEFERMMSKLAAIEAIASVRAKIKEAEKKKPKKFVECGCCEFFHPASFGGDCRDNDNRFDADQLDKKYGLNGWEIVGEDDEEEEC